MEELSLEEAVTKARTEGTADSYLEVFNQIKAFGFYICKPYVSAGSIEAEEQDSIIFLAVARALRSHNDSKTYDFVTAVKYALYNELLMASVKNSPVKIPANMQSDVWRYKRTYTSFINEHQRKPHLKEMCAALGWDTARTRGIRDLEWALHLRYLDAEVKDDSSTTLAELVPSGYDLASEMAEQIDRERISEEIHAAVSDLPSAEQQVIVSRWLNDSGEQRTLADIAAETGVVKQTIKNRELKAFRILRKDARVLALAEEFSEFRQTGFNSWISNNASVEEHYVLWAERKKLI